MLARWTSAARGIVSCCLTVTTSPLHTWPCRIERRIRYEEPGGTASVKNDPLCIKSVFHGLLEIQYIKG